MHPVEEYHLDRGRVKLCAICDANKKKVDFEQLYKADEDRKSGSWREDAGKRNMSQRGWAPRPPVEQPRRTGKKRCYGHKSGGQYVAVLFRSPTPSHTVKSLVTLSNPFK